MMVCLKFAAKYTMVRESYTWIFLWTKSTTSVDMNQVLAVRSSAVDDIDTCGSSQYMSMGVNEKCPLKRFLNQRFERFVPTKRHKDLTKQPQEMHKYID